MSACFGDRPREGFSDEDREGSRRLVGMIPSKQK